MVIDFKSIVKKPQKNWVDPKQTNQLAKSKGYLIFHKH